MAVNLEQELANAKSYIKRLERELYPERFVKKKPPSALPPVAKAKPKFVHADANKQNIEPGDKVAYIGGWKPKRIKFGRVHHLTKCRVHVTPPGSAYKVQLNHDQVLIVKKGKGYYEED